ncbi:DsrE/DsrF/DrsH-like family protein [Paludibacter jiangxiensis]|uniref:Peroxiredoxin family protein n=1 Tax=Paludibacter jiangxiensis TaxID=681398 RepID=A0A170ZHS6_9BACT|nr:DsrE/DsrF/DrsH-like family protein [Paludibacter jiangxiensis]GAT62680.1 peroxiredoxin family protein [Paludibacter jiangxiensis]
MANELEAQVQLLEAQLKKLQKNQPKDQLSIIVFSGDLDKVLAAMIIATGARAMDMEVKMFFTFWGTAMLRDKNKSPKGKDFMSKMFGFMLPKGSTKLKLSKLNMFGMGTAMLKDLMKKKNVASLEDLIATAAEFGVEICICEMSMNLMGFKKEEMIDYPNLSYVGVGTYLSDADESKIQLFI